MHISITGIGSISALGSSIQEHEKSIRLKKSALKPLSQCEWLDSSILLSKKTLGGWIEDRSICLSRKWAPASKLAIEATKEAVKMAGLTPKELEHTAVIAGSSRGNAYLKNWPNRRPIKLMAASNSMHGEIASAITIEFGIRGPWQVLSSGCAASLDAIGHAYMLLRTGVVKKAIVIGVELPLINTVVEDYQNTGVLAEGAVNDPYSPLTTGFHPGESASAIILEAQEHKNHPELLGYWCNSDAASPIGMPADGNGLSKCIDLASNALKEIGEIQAICPHASGTSLHAQAEQKALENTLGRKREKTNSPISLHILKPFTGHTVGASGMLDTAILAHFLNTKSLPLNLPNLTQPSSPFYLPEEIISFSDGILLKISVGMGGHNSIVALRA